MNLFYMLLLCCSILFFGCATHKKPVAPETLQIFVSIAPQKYIVEKIAGDHGAVTTLIPSGASPHTFEPKPARLAALSRADCYFTIGLAVENAWLPRLDIKDKGPLVVATDSGIEKTAMGSSCDHEHDHHHHHAAGTDPHIWLSPSLVKNVAATVTATLCRLDTAHAAYFKTRLVKFEQEADSLATVIRTMIDSCGTGETFLVFHPSWGYFAKEFSLRQAAIEIDGSEPSLRELGEIAAEARNRSIRTIFIQPQFSRKTAEMIARQIGAQVVVADPMAEAWGENLVSFAEALCR